MTEPLAQYDPVQVVGAFTGATFGSVDILNGAIDGDFAALTRDAKRWALETDNAGNATRVKNNKKSGQVTVSLSASSPTNTRLSTLATIDDTTENVVGTLTLRDLNGNTRVVATGAFLEDIPDPSFGQDRGQRAWVFLAARVVVFAGGHNPA